MISGTVTEDHEAVVRLAVFGKAGQREPIEAVVDTGFTGWLSLPRSLINDLELPWQIEGSRRIFKNAGMVTSNNRGHVLTVAPGRGGAPPR